MLSSHLKPTCYKEKKRGGKEFGIQRERLIRYKLQSGNYPSIPSSADQQLFMCPGQWTLSPWNTGDQIWPWSLAVLMGHKGWISYGPPGVRVGPVMQSSLWNKSFLPVIITKPINYMLNLKTFNFWVPSSVVSSVLLYTSYYLVIFLSLYFLIIFKMLLNWKFNYFDTATS